MYRRISYVPWLLRSFFNAHNAHFGQILPVTLLPVVSLPALHLEHDDLLIPELANDLRIDLGSVDDGRSDYILLAADHEDFIERNGIALFSCELFYTYGIAFFYLILFAACFYNRIHDAPQLGLSKNEELLMKVSGVVKEFQPYIENFLDWGIQNELSM